MSLAVVAVIFGSRDSSLGFSNLHDTTEVNAICEWGNRNTLKIPTSILIESGKKFAAIGYEAEELYEKKSVGCDDLEDWWLFRNFTKLTNTQAYVNDVVVQDIKGRSLPATKVLSMAVKCMVDKFTRVLPATGFSLRDITFVFTVPTSWNSTAKKCMKVAASEADLLDGQVLLVQDTEAASIMCQKEMETLGKDKTVDSKCLAVNWNDDELDLSIIARKFDGTLRVNFLARSNVIGMDAVLNKYLVCLSILCGVKDVNKMKLALETSDILALRMVLKKASLTSTNRKIVIQISPEIRQMLQERKEMEKLSKGGKLRLDIDCVTEWFRESIDEGIAHIKTILSEQGNVTDVLLFGDFTENVFVRESVVASLGQRVIVPEDVEIAVIKGAVIYGHFPEIVASRITRSHYLKQSKGALPLVVASFDFGTTYSGYAYSFRNTPKDIWTNKGWNSGQNISLKAPTCVLLDHEKNFHSFGYDAENKYSSLADDDEHHGWMFFRRFKMTLHNQVDLNRDATVEDISGKKMPALTIFSMAIRYLKEELVKAIQKSKDGINESDILYMLTVPAIWSDAAKQFMKEAAIMAGIDAERIKLALEPEAASVWCQHIQTDARKALSEVGTQFMVADLGGGTADISVQEKQPNGTLTEIHRASGGAWGGTNVDRNFLKWLTSLVGERAMATFKEKDMIDFVELEREFEVKKRTIRPDTSGVFTFKISPRLCDIHEQITGSKMAETIAKLQLKDVSFARDKLKVPNSVAKAWFMTPITETVKHVRGILDEKKMKQVRIVMLVGGFSECLLLQYAFCFELKDKQLVIPEEAGIAVLKGAVEYGLKQNVISSRIMKYAYGIAKTVEYNSVYHDKSKARSQDTGLVVDVFEIFVDVDDEILDGETVTKGFVPTKKASTHVQVYSSTQPNPKYVTDLGCKQIGQLMVDHAEGVTLEDKIFNVQFEFGKTEIVVTIVKQKSGEEISTRIDCL